MSAEAITVSNMLLLAIGVGLGYWLRMILDRRGRR